MTIDKKAAISMDIMAISIISIIVVVISIMVYFSIIERNKDNIENLSEAEECPENFTCTQHQCLDIVGASPMVANLKSPVGFMCCGQQCVCPKEGDNLDIRGRSYYCEEKKICNEGEEQIGLRTLGSGVCCCS